jgi:hypothetical protein
MVPPLQLSGCDFMCLADFLERPHDHLSTWTQSNPRIHLRFAPTRFSRPKRRYHGSGSYSEDPIPQTEGEGSSERYALGIVHLFFSAPYRKFYGCVAAHWATPNCHFSSLVVDYRLLINCSFRGGCFRGPTWVLKCSCQVSPGALLPTPWYKYSRALSTHLPLSGWQPGPYLKASSKPLPSTRLQWS